VTIHKWFQLKNDKIYYIHLNAFNSYFTNLGKTLYKETVSTVSFNDFFTETIKGSDILNVFINLKDETAAG